MAAAAVAAPVAAVPVVIAPSPAAAAAGALPYATPADVRGAMEIYSYARTVSPHIQFVLEGDTARGLDDEDLRHYYSGHPHSMQRAEPDDLRRLFADGDGVLFALFAERYQLRDDRPSTEGAALLDAICATPFVTDAGAATLPAPAAVPSDKAAAMVERIRTIVEQIEDLEASLVTLGSAAYLLFMADILERRGLGGEPLPDVPDEVGAIDFAYPQFREDFERDGKPIYGLRECWIRRGVLPPGCPLPGPATRLGDRGRS